MYSTQAFRDYIPHYHQHSFIFQTLPSIRILVCTKLTRVFLQDKQVTILLPEVLQLISQYQSPVYSLKICFHPFAFRRETDFLMVFIAWITFHEHICRWFGIMNRYGEEFSADKFCFCKTFDVKWNMRVLHWKLFKELLYVSLSSLQF